MMKQSHGLKSNIVFFFTLFIFALVVRTTYFLEFKQNPYFDNVYPAHDSIVIYNGAKDICQGDLLLSKKGNRYPFYTYFVAVTYFLGGQKIYGVWITQFVLGALASGLLFLIGTRLFNRKVGVIVSLFYALYGPNLFYEGVMLRAALTEFLAVLSFYFLLRLDEKISYNNLISSGIALSMMIQCRPNTVVVLPLVLLYLYFRTLREEVFKRKLLYFSSFLFALIIIGMPLLLRGMYVEGKFQFYDPGGPSVLLMGNLVDYDGSGWQGGSPRYQELKKIHSHEVSHDYVWVLKRVLKEVIDYPMGFIALYGRKIYHFFNNCEIPSNNNFYLHQRFSYLLKNPLSNFSLVASLAFLGLVVTFKDYRKNILLYAFLLGMTGSVLIFYNVSRFRVPAVPFYLLFSSMGVYALYHFVLAKKYGRFLLASVLVIGLLFYLRTPDVKKIRENDYGMLASIYFDNGLYDEAIIAYKQALAINPRYALAHSNMGAAYDMKGMLNEAISECKRALAIEPGYEKAHYNLGVAYHKKGSLNKAIVEYRKALAINPHNATVYENLALIYESKNLYRESIKVYEELLELQPNNFKAHGLLANAYLKVKVWDKARYHFTEVLRLRPDHPHAKEIKEMIGKLSEI